MRGVTPEEVALLERAKAVIAALKQMDIDDVASLYFDAQEHGGSLRGVEADDLRALTECIGAIRAAYRR